MHDCTSLVYLWLVTMFWTCLVGTSIWVRKKNWGNCHFRTLLLRKKSFYPSLLQTSTQANTKIVEIILKHFAVSLIQFLFIPHKSVNFVPAYLRPSIYKQTLTPAGVVILFVMKLWNRNWKINSFFFLYSFKYFFKIFCVFLPCS